MFKLIRLVASMAEVEGWTANKAGSPTAGSRSFRNHNPLNLRKSPFEVANVQGFSVFHNDLQGFIAGMWDIMQKAKGNTSTGLNGESTLREFISVWAPWQDGNDTEAYLMAVCKKTGIDPSERLRDIVG